MKYRDRRRLLLLARALWHEGYDDHLAGHITVNQGDGTLLCNPWLLTWEEFGYRLGGSQLVMRLVDHVLKTPLGQEAAA